MKITATFLLIIWGWLILQISDCRQSAPAMVAISDCIPPSHEVRKDSTAFVQTDLQLRILEQNLSVLEYDVARMCETKKVSKRRQLRVDTREYTSPY